MYPFKTIISQGHAILERVNWFNVVFTDIYSYVR